MKVRDLAKMIDHSLLHPTITDADLRSGCEIAAKYACATVCVKPYAVSLAAELLAEADCDICAVAGFPHGNSHTSIIVAEAELACEKELVKLISWPILVRRWVAIGTTSLPNSKR